jgi:glycosyltransferase involved in cell wall biosynthesis
MYTRGGIARYTWALASAVGDLVGAENVHVLALLSGNGSVDAPTRFRIIDTISTRPTFSAKLRFAKRALALGRTKYNLVICTHVALSPLAWLIHRAHRTPYWVVCHGIEAWRRLPLGERQALTRADLVLPISRFTAEKVQGLNGVPRGKTKILYNAIGDEFARMLLRPDEPARSCANANKNEKVILSVGMLSRDLSYKGFDQVIRALPKVRQEVPNARCVIVGEGDDKENLMKLGSELGVSRYVEFDGAVADDFLAARYRTCDVFALPSRARQIKGRWQGEGFGRVYAEAALAGKPSVGSHEGGAAEAVLHGTTGFLVDPESITELSSALVTLLKNPELAAQMGSNARQWATANFTCQAVRSHLAGMLSPLVP